MKTHIKTILVLLTIAVAAFAADLTYTTLIADNDSALVAQNKVNTALTGQSNKFANVVLAAPTTTTIKSGSGVLVGIICNTPASTATLTVYDNTAGSGTKIGTILGTDRSMAIYNCRFGTGLTVVSATAAADWTIVYR